MRNEMKRRDREDYVLSESNKGIVTSIDDIVQSALIVSNNNATQALEFLHRTGVDREDAVMGRVVEKLEAMQ